MTVEAQQNECGPDIVRPEDCALGIAIPLSLDQLKQDLDCPQKEFARRYVLERLGVTSADEAWDAGYGALVDRLRQVFDLVKVYGAHVQEGVQLADLPALFSRHKVVSLFAHGPFPSLTLDDVLSPDTLLAAVSAKNESYGAPRHAVVEWLTKSDDIRMATSLVEVVKALKLRINRTREYYHRLGDAPDDVDFLAGLEAMKPEAGLTRMLLSEGLPRVFRSPPIIELRDDVHDFETFCGKVPSGFSGTTDFTVCSALWFVEALRRRFPGCCDLLCPKQPADVWTRSLLYKATIHQLKLQPMRFSAAVLAVHQAAFQAMNHCKDLT